MTIRYLLLFGLLVAGGFIGVVLLSPLVDSELPTPASEGLVWERYEHEGLGFALDHPAAYQPVVRDGDDTVAFLFEGEALARVALIGVDQGRRRGLWAKHEPIGQTQLGRRPGRLYLYNHFDLFSGVAELAHVVDYRDRELALVFRLRKATLLEQLGLKLETDTSPDPVRQRMLESFRFL